MLYIYVYTYKSRLKGANGLDTQAKNKKEMQPTGYISFIIDIVNINF